MADESTANCIDILLAIILPPLGVFLKYGCKMLGHTEFLDKALQFIREWIHGDPASAVWTANLGACKRYKNFNLGVEVAKQLMNLEPENPGHHIVLLLNIYASSGRMDRVEMVGNVLIRKGLKNQTGHSLIEIN